MKPDRRRVDHAAALQHLYDQIPGIECRGLCHTTCGPIHLTALEQRRITTRHHVTIPNRAAFDPTITCEALTPVGRCAVYPDRPLLCRLWGVVDAMPCVYGCQPDRYLTAAQGHALLAQADALDHQEEPRVPHTRRRRRH